VVIQEIFGVNAHIRAVTDRFAAEGYLAVAPAIFDHVAKGFDVGYDPESRAQGMAAVGKVDFEQTLRDAAAKSGSSAIASAGPSPGPPPRASPASPPRSATTAGGFWRCRTCTRESRSCCTSARRIPTFRSRA
jgi:hypothetical protein